MPPATRLTPTELDKLLAGRRGLRDDFAARRWAWPIVSASTLSGRPIENVLAEEFRLVAKISRTRTANKRRQRSRQSRPGSCSSGATSGLTESAERELQERGESSAARVDLAARAAREELLLKYQRGDGPMDSELSSLDPVPESRKGKRRASLAPIKEEKELRAAGEGITTALQKQGLGTGSPEEPERGLDEADDNDVDDDDHGQDDFEDGVDAMERQRPSKRRRIMNRSEWQRVKSKSKTLRKSHSRQSQSSLKGAAQYERIACDLCGRPICRARMAWHKRHKHPTPVPGGPEYTNKVLDGTDDGNDDLSDDGEMSDKGSDDQPLSAHDTASDHLQAINFQRDVSSEEATNHSQLYPEDGFQFKLPWVKVEDEEMELAADAADTPQDKNGYASRRRVLDPLEKVPCGDCDRMIARARLGRHRRTHHAGTLPSGQMDCPFCSIFHTKSRSSLGSHVSRCHREEAHMVRSAISPKVSWDALAAAFQAEALGQLQSTPQPDWMVDLLDALPLQAWDLMRAMSKPDVLAEACKAVFAPEESPDDSHSLKSNGVGSSHGGKSKAAGPADSLPADLDEETDELDELDELPEGDVDMVLS